MSTWAYRAVDISNVVDVTVQSETQAVSTSIGFAGLALTAFVPPQAVVVTPGGARAANLLVPCCAGIQARATVTQTNGIIRAADSAAKHRSLVSLCRVCMALFYNFLCCTQDVVPEDSMKEEIMDSIQKGNFTMRILKDQLQNILKMGPVGQVMGMIPGFANNMMPKVCAPHCMSSNHIPSSSSFAMVLWCLLTQLNVPILKNIVSKAFPQFQILLNVIRTTCKVFTDMYQNVSNMCAPLHALTERGNVSCSGHTCCCYHQEGCVVG